MKLIGYYDESGYSIKCINGPTLYEAGNHRQDSTAYAEPGSGSALSLNEIKLCCRRTLSAMCHELRATNMGIEPN